MSFNHDIAQWGWAAEVDRCLPFLHERVSEGLIKGGYTIISEPVIYASNKWYGANVKGYGYVPIELNYGVLLNSQQHGLSGHRYSFGLGSFHFDHSNCGVAHFHQISNGGKLGVGSHVLRMIEGIASSVRRKFITCTAASHQNGGRAFEWLEKHNYHMLSEFQGGNSGNTCRIYAKDLNIHPYTEPIKRAKTAS